jgi:hypothetical protein
MQQQPAFVDCLSEPLTRPQAFILACGDGNSRLSSLHWANWNGMSATAMGINLVNDCKPYCAAGTFRAYPVVVRLSDPAPWKKNPQVEHFTRLSLTFPGNRPEGYRSVMTYSLWN